MAVQSEQTTTFMFINRHKVNVDGASQHKCSYKFCYVFLITLWHIYMYIFISIQDSFNILFHLFFKLWDYYHWRFNSLHSEVRSTIERNVSLHSNAVFFFLSVSFCRLSLSHTPLSNWQKTDAFSYSLVFFPIFSSILSTNVSAFKSNLCFFHLV